jgi:ABC-type multidrug transport system fused ATPase/permease subunit
MLIHASWLCVQLRLQIGLVSQEPLLFSGSVLDNIMYGKPDSTMAEVNGRPAKASMFVLMCSSCNWHLKK